MKSMFKFFLVLALCFGALGVVSGPVSAQGGCQDPSGNPIPCPTDTPDDSKKATPTPVPPTRAPNTATPIPTETPLSLAAPTEVPHSGKAEWSGVCNNATCIAQFTNGCESVGGTVDIGEIKEGTVPLTCKVPMEEYEPEIVLAAPNEEPGTGKAEWSGVCNNTTCIAQFTNGCESVGGTVEIGEIKEGTVPLTCKVPMEEYEPGIALADAPSDPGETGKSGFVGDCASSVNLGACMDGFVNMCLSLGGTPDEMYDEDAMGPTGKVGCSDIPSTSDNALLAPTPSSGFPPSRWLPWITGLSGLLIGLLLPAVQKVRDPAPRAGQTREHVLLNKEDDGNTELEPAGSLNLTDKPDGGSTDHKDWIRIESISHEPDSGASSGAMPQTKEHVLLNKDDEPQADDEPTIKNKEEDGGTEAGYLKLGDIKGETND